MACKMKAKELQWLLSTAGSMIDAPGDFDAEERAHKIEDLDAAAKRVAACWCYTGLPGDRPLRKKKTKR